ncbi:MAG: FHA domain-containing protein [Deltaproteobacteria bacterium]
MLFDTAGGRAKRAGTEQTMMIDARAIRSLARAKLVVLGGRRQGTEYPLRGTEVAIGRDPTNDIVIADISISRKHARLRRAPTGWLVADTGGNNGTRVNGLAIEEVLLHDGDILELGGTELRFVDQPEPEEDGDGEAEEGPADGAQRASSRGRPNRRLMVVATAVVALLVVIAALKAANDKRGLAGAGALAGPDRFADARKLVLAQKWEPARELLLKAQQDDPDNPEIRRYLETVTAEIENQRHIDAASVALKKGDVATAEREIGLVPMGSLLADPAAELKGQIDQAVAALADKAAQSLAQGDLASTKELLDRALAADPAQPAALALVPKLASAAALQRASASERARLEAQRQAQLRLERGPVGQARALFHNGDVAGAISILRTATGSDAAPAARLLPDISQFSAAFQRGKAAEQARRSQAAIDQLTLAHDLALRISGADGAMSIASGRLLAMEHDRLGFQARSGRQLDKAFRHFTAAQEAFPGDDQSKEQLGRLATDAHELFLTAYSQMETDPVAAARNLKLVLGMTAPGSSEHERAQARLSQLSGHPAAE